VDPETGPWKAIALASATVATGLIGILTAMVRKAKPEGMTNGNKILLDRLERLERQIHLMNNDVIQQGHDIANVKGRLGLD